MPSSDVRAVVQLEKLRRIQLEPDAGAFDHARNVADAVESLLVCHCHEINFWEQVAVKEDGSVWEFLWWRRDYLPVRRGLTGGGTGNSVAALAPVLGKELISAKKMKELAGDDWPKPLEDK